MSECGFIGLGRMGGAMAQRLIAAGHQVTVYDPSAAATAALAAHGARVAGAAREVADAAPVVFLSLPTPQIVTEVVLGPRASRPVSAWRCALTCPPPAPRPPWPWRRDWPPAALRRWRPRYPAVSAVPVRAPWP